MTRAWALGALALAGCGAKATPSSRTPEAVAETETETETDLDLVIGALAPLAPTARGGVGLAAGATPPSSAGALTPAAIKAVVRAARGKFAACYQRALPAAPTLSGAVRVEFTIGAVGTVVSAVADGLDPTVDACVAGELRALVFPPPTGGGVVTVRYPFTFKPN